MLLHEKVREEHEKGVGPYARPDRSAVGSGRLLGGIRRPTQRSGPFASVFVGQTAADVRYGPPRRSLRCRRLLFVGFLRRLLSRLSSLLHQTPSTNSQKKS